MSEKNILDKSRFHTVMPVEIKIRTYRNLFEPRAFDKDGQPLFLLEKSDPIYVRDDNYDLFTDELYTELLSIGDTKNAADFCNKYPDYCISFPDDFGYEYKTELININCYFNLMIKSIEKFKTSETIYKDVYVMLSEPDNMDAVKKAAKALIDNARSMPYHNAEGVLLKWLLRPKELSPDVKNAIDIAVGSFQREIDRMTNTIESASLFKPCVEFRCPSLITAMYQKLIVSAYNNEEYRQCANKHCTNYFKVGNRTTQKYCEKHLEARRRKQKKYLEKQKQEI